MRKKNFTFCLLAAVILSGCGTKKAPALSGDFLFDLPGKYSLADITEDHCSLLCDDEPIGGILITNLDPSSIADANGMAILQYLETFAPLPLTYEYIAMYCDTEEHTYTNITLRVTDPETGTSNNYHHYLFEKDSLCYDLWIDDTCMQEEDQQALLTGILPQKK